MHKPFAESCEQNKRPIRDVLARYLRPGDRVLEIGSGTGQHAVFFGAEFPGVQWQPSDTRDNLPGISLWREEAGLANVLPALALDVTRDWPAGPFPVVFSANTVHIMDWDAVVALFAGVGRVLGPGGLFLLYGPFNYHGDHTSPSNARFDAWLKERDPRSGIRDVDDLDAQADANGLVRIADHEMPVNNRILVWRRP